MGLTFFSFSFKSIRCNCKKNKIIQFIQFKRGAVRPTRSIARVEFNLTFVFTSKRHLQSSGGTLIPSSDLAVPKTFEDPLRLFRVFIFFSST